MTLTRGIIQISHDVDNIFSKDENSLKYFTNIIHFLFMFFFIFIFYLYFINLHYLPVYTF